ncbi:hypothetical protein RIF29_29701 [Crotalaria pallida]|uniref:T-complex protein 1 subunit beta n=1 Tax=Crotalaria pallida TaxID=3830 RepID=A0AAN9EHD1_CROPI
MIGEDKLIHFSGVAMGQACTIVLRGPSHHGVLQGGWPEMVMAKEVDELARKTPGKKSLAIEAFSRGLLAIPTIIADNAGLDGAELISQLLLLLLEFCAALVFLLHLLLSKLMGTTICVGRFPDEIRPWCKARLRLWLDLLIGLAEVFFVCDLRRKETDCCRERDGDPPNDSYPHNYINTCVSNHSEATEIRNIWRQYYKDGGYVLQYDIIAPMPDDKKKRLGSNIRDLGTLSEPVFVTNEDPRALQDGEAQERDGGDLMANYWSQQQL